MQRHSILQGYLSLPASQVSTSTKLAEEHKEKDIVGDPEDAENKSQVIKCAICLQDFVAKVKLEEHI